MDARLDLFSPDYNVATGKRFDVGKSCVRFKRIADLPLPLIGETVGSMSVSELIALVQDGASVRKARTKAAGAAATKRGAKNR